MKNTIEWHEQCFESQKSYLKSKKIEINRLVNDFKKLEADMWFYERQIEIAKTRRMDGFDRNRFLKSRKRKNMTDTTTLSDQTALIDALRLAVKNAGEKFADYIKLEEIYSYIEARSMLQQIDFRVEHSDEKIKTALDSLLG